MIPIRTDRTNFLYKGNGTDIDDLPGEITSAGAFVATFTLTDEERDILAVDGVIQLHIWAKPIPPIALAVGKPL